MVDQWQMSALKPGIDAYVDWLRGPGGKYPPPYDEQSLLVCLNPGMTLAGFRKRFAEARHRLGGVALPLLCGYDDLEHFTTTASRDAIAALQQVRSLRECIHRVVVAQRLPDDAMCPSPRAAARYANGQLKTEPHDVRRRNGRGERGAVVVGVIEEGIAIANQRFRRGNCDSRVEFAWVQDARCVGFVQGFGYGRELRKHDSQGMDSQVADKGIDSLLRECLRGGQINEDLFYAKAGLADFARPGHKAVAQRASHGALVMDLACGYDQGASPVGNDGLDQRPIVCVQLPTITVADTSGLGLERYMLDGLNYILNRADRIAEARGCEPLPAVVNFSSGVLAGPHDGTHPIERAIDEIIEHRRRYAPTEVVLPSGNSYLSRIHASVAVPPKRAKNGDARLALQVLPDDRTCTYVEVWLPQPRVGADAVGVELMLQPPGGEVSPALSDSNSKRALAWRPNRQDTVCKVYYEYFGPPTNRGRYMIALLPTACHDAPTQLTPCGDWSILLRNRTSRPIANIEAWIQWDDRPLGYPRSGRQAYFRDPAYQRFDKISGREVEVDNASMVKRAGTMSAIATGAKTVVVGAFKRKEGLMSSYSGAGAAARDAARAGPDAVIASDDSSVHVGILAAATRSRSVVTPNGTSVAAPQVTRAIADRLASGDRRVGRAIIKTLANEQEGLRPPTPPQPSAARGGAGRIVLPRSGSRVAEKRIVDQ
jgi:hypothetical protein